MITIEDCYGFCDLEEETIQAIASHEHLNEIVAIELAQDLLKQEGGIARLHAMIEEDINWAKNWGQLEQAVKYEKLLKDFDERFSQTLFR